MQFDSMAEILRFAISKEQASVQFYRDLASQSKDPSTQQLFQALANNEANHVETLQLEMNKIGYTTNPEIDLRASEFEFEERLEMDDQARNMDFVDGFLLAIQKERAAFRLYTQILGTTANEKFSNILMELAEEEMRHVLQLEKEYELLRNRRD